MKRKIEIKKTHFALLFLLLATMIVPLSAIQTATAHTPAWEIPTYAYIATSHNPIGIGQNVLIVVWLDKVLPNADLPNDVRFHNYKLTITAPNGDITTKTWDVVEDTTSSTFYSFTPDQTGTYMLNFTYPGQTYTWTDPVFDYTYGIIPNENTNDTYLASSASTTLEVQQEPITTSTESPLPTEYWTRPINGENTNWYTIASNWLGSLPAISYNVQPDGSAPSTSHIMWSKTLAYGGVVGGSTGATGSTYYAGDSYQGRFANPIIIQGRLYYPLPRSTATQSSFINIGSGGYVCVDLQTGEQIWYKDYAVCPSFGQLLYFDAPNQHGTIPNGVLWAVSGNTWIAYDPIDGEWLYNITNIPQADYFTGSSVYGPVYGSNGEVLLYQIDPTNKWIAEWNSTKAIIGTASGISSASFAPVGQNIDGGQSYAYSWNITLPSTTPLGSKIIKAVAGDFALCSTLQTTYGGYGTQQYTVTMINLNDDSLGTTKITTYQPPSGNITRQHGPVDTINRVFTMVDQETMQWSGYNLDTGQKLWGPVGNAPAYQYYSSAVQSYNDGAYSTAYGNLYIAGYGGIVYCYDTTTGALKWSYGNGGNGNSTQTSLDSVWPNRPLFIAAIADGKIYLFNNEHSPNSPLYKDAKVRCINATTGTEIWDISSWDSSGDFYAQGGAIADGYLAYQNTYDGKIYTIGKGPSAMTAEVQQFGSSMVIRGTATDIAAGTKQTEQAARFPNGIAIVSEESMSAWMEYVYMQHNKPANATGVPIAINVVDANGNYRTIGTTVSDTSGMYTFTWKPDISGDYKVIANFAGSTSYYPSYAETSFTVESPTATPSPQPTQQPSAADLYFLPGIAIVIVVVVIVGMAILLSLKKHP